MTHFGKRLTDAEAITDTAEAYANAQRLSTRLGELAVEFKDLHYKVVSAVAEGDDAANDAEQVVLDDHEKELDGYYVRLQLLLEGNQPDTAGNTESRTATLLGRKLAFLGETIRSISSTLSAAPLSGAPELALVQQCQDELLDAKGELANCLEALATLGVREDNELYRTYLRLKTQHFDCSRIGKERINKITAAPTERATPTATEKETETGLRVPKLNAPTFDGDILNWTRFWEQFSVSIDSRKNLSDAEKFAYLQQALKDSTAKSLIEGLSGTGENYAKAIACLWGRYDRPRLIHQSHVKAILETAPIKDNSGKELRRLHDSLQQHLCALDISEAESTDLSCFITSVIQLKLDSDTLFEWQRHTQDVNEVPPFPKILEFIDLRARAAETTAGRAHKRPLKFEVSHKRNIASFVTSTDCTQQGNCVICKSEKHPLHSCNQFKGMSHDRKLDVIKTNNLCMNCLKAGHFLKACKSSHLCRTCNKRHHTLLHVNPTTPPNVVSSNTSSIGIRNGVLMMTCLVLIRAPNGNKMRVRALLDSASSSSFVSERVVQGMGLDHSSHTISISGVAGLTGHRGWG